MIHALGWFMERLLDLADVVAKRHTDHGQYDSGKRPFDPPAPTPAQGSLWD